MNQIRIALSLLLVFGGFGAAFGFTAAGNPILGGICLIGGCLLGAAVAPR